MITPILHHYDLSPLCERNRLAMGSKDLDWISVKLDAVPPRPALDALTGGFPCYSWGPTFSATLRWSSTPLNG